MAEVASGLAALGDAIAVLRRESRERVKAHLTGLPQTVREGLKAARIRQGGTGCSGSNSANHCCASFAGMPRARASAGFLMPTCWRLMA